MVSRHVSATFLASLVFSAAFVNCASKEYNNFADVPCGQRNIGIRTAKLVGGQNAIPHEFPWMVSISRKGGHFCGGTILNSKYVLTAAHCLCSSTSVIPTNQLRISLGEYNLKGPEIPASKEERVVNAILHPGHKCGKYADDIAILELARPIIWSESVKPACLPVATGKPGYSTFNGELAKAAGWGWFGEDRSKYKRADVLQKVEVRVIENNICREWYASQGKSTRVESKQMCAGHEEGGRDSCWGDSGGPLMITSHLNGNVMVVGIVSSGVGCARPRLPGVYTRVSEYISWITQHIL
ncbi:transmembrane protease serine 9 [Apis mellifera caucasica]|uniref:Transmembrane protease serine 9 n=1 Tax=Apis mellifera TaxID=7460 RepID=A0A7M7H5C9_APIME|nr:transmembrane protease serine 9 [Apis mellifera]KAG6797175.1 transmembrane protease serine 9 [Apis mellifera caucasica]|eukprot:XP_006571469.1 transmembrane protease serine 9 [Apis mellifera]